MELQVRVNKKAIRDADKGSTPSGAGDEVLFEPLLDYFSRLMEVYQAKEEEIDV